MPESRSSWDDLPVGVALVSAAGELIEANACLAQWLGQPVGLLRGSRIDDWLTRAGRVLYHTHVLPTLHLHGQLQELSLSLQSGDMTLPVLACASLGGAVDARTVRLVMSPMRERQRLERQLQRAQRAADAAPVLLFEYERDALGRGVFTYLSAGVERLYGPVEQASMVPEQALWSHVHPDDLPGLLRAREDSVRAGGVWGGHFRVRAQGASDWAIDDILATPQPMGDDRWTWYGTIADVTRQHEIEQSAQLREAAQRASAAKSEFMARTSHELRTPLNGILGFSQLMAEDAREPLGPEQRRRLGVVNASAMQLLALINELLDIARIEAGELRLLMQPVRLLPLLQQALAAIEPMATGAGLSMTLQCPFTVAVQADATRLQQVLTNLLSNAVKYNIRQGQVAVVVRHADAQVRIDVQDSGPGMSAAQLRQLFQPFNRLGAERTATEGSGLGLVISRQLVEAMGGRLEVTSQPGQGSTFSVTLSTAAARPAAVPREEGMPGARPPGPRRRVLYAEDNPVNALLMEQVLAPLDGVELRLAASGEEALACAAQWPPDLLLLDMHLGDMDGRTLLGRLRDLPGLAGVPAVAVSADAMPDDVALARASGFQDYWTKPIDVHRLRIGLLQALERREAPP
ncbi:PAS domain-containing hybrid sensor histidine kinase/response regulator [Ideonella alba]|uniref:histidine kinase n=1 Tax=Ideonella alba TaxID=2824118 RepID=A0A941BFV1_9BURK|nr:PAS domain-containing hybrid sensor histidine kinase/response regulator [Ideonella alba]MBQ0931427.1 response regulator [Ideonella alba]